MNLVAYYPPREVGKVMCGGCLVRLALANQGSPETLQPLTELEMAIQELRIASPEETSGSMATTDNPWSFGTNQQESSSGEPCCNYQTGMSTGSR